MSQETRAMSQDFINKFVPHGSHLMILRLKGAYFG